PIRHWRRPRPTLRDSPPRAATRGSEVKWLPAFSFATNKIVGHAARARPFLDPGEVIVIAVMRPPHRMDQRTIGRALVVEILRKLRQLGERPVGLAVGSAVLENDGLRFAGGLAALQQDIDQFGDRTAGGYADKAALAQHCGFQGELWRQARAYLLFGPRRPGLVIKDDVTPIAAKLDAVGATAQLERALAQRDLDLAAGFGGERGNGDAAD